MNPFLVFVFFLLTLTNIFGQTTLNTVHKSDRSKRGYIVMNENYTKVYIIDHKNKFSQCLVKNQETIKTYNPDDISEYGFDKGHSFVVKSVKIDGETRKLFLERFYYNNSSLFFLKYKGNDYYFIERNGSLLEITNANISNIFSTLPNNCNSIDGIELSQKSILKFLDCNPPSIRLVLSGGSGSFAVKSFTENPTIVGHPTIFDKSGKKISFSLLRFSQIRKSNFIDESNFFFGFGLDITKYSLENSLLSGGSNEGIDFTNSTEVISDQMRVSIPLVLRYWNNVGKLGFIADIGIINSFSFNEVLVTNVRTSDQIETSKSVKNIAPNYQIGFLGRTGLSYSISNEFISEITYGSTWFIGGEFKTYESNISIGLTYKIR